VSRRTPGGRPPAAARTTTATLNPGHSGTRGRSRSLLREPTSIPLRERIDRRGPGLLAIPRPARPPGTQFRSGQDLGRPPARRVDGTAGDDSSEAGRPGGSCDRPGIRTDGRATWWTTSFLSPAADGTPRRTCSGRPSRRRERKTDTNGEAATRRSAFPFEDRAFTAAPGPLHISRITVTSRGSSEGSRSGRKAAGTTDSVEPGSRAASGSFDSPTTLEKRGSHSPSPIAWPYMSTRQLFEGSRSNSRKIQSLGFLGEAWKERFILPTSGADSHRNSRRRSKRGTARRQRLTVLDVRGALSRGGLAVSRANARKSPYHVRNADR